MEGSEDSTESDGEYGIDTSELVDYFKSVCLMILLI